MPCDISYHSKKIDGAANTKLTSGFAVTFSRGALEAWCCVEVPGASWDRRSLSPDLLAMSTDLFGSFGRRGSVDEWMWEVYVVLLGFQAMNENTVGAWKMLLMLGSE